MKIQSRSITLFISIFLGVALNFLIAKYLFFISELSTDYTSSHAEQIIIKEKLILLSLSALFVTYYLLGSFTKKIFKKDSKISILYTLPFIILAPLFYSYFYIEFFKTISPFCMWGLGFEPTLCDRGPKKDIFIYIYSLIPLLGYTLGIFNYKNKQNIH